jgi:putative ATP-binding cassette transporter
MDAEAIPLRVTATRLVRSVRNFAASDVGGKAKAIFAALATLLVAATGLNVVNSYVGRNFMTAIADRDSSAFVTQAFLFVGVFAASTIVSVIARFAEERLGLLWREMLTRRAVVLYLANGAYHRLNASGALTNPDQRISEDIRAFTVTTLSFVLMALNSVFAIVAFSEVLWSISRTLFVVAVLYAALGSLAIFVLGRPLVRLNFDQLDREASFRSALIHVRENAGGILLAQAEPAQARRLNDRLNAFVENFRQITTVNRNVGFFSTGYNWLIQIIPALIIAPSFIRGEVEFGVITQSAMVFTTLVAAFSLVVTQFQSLSAFAAVVARLNGLMEAIERSEPATDPESVVQVEETSDRVAFERLTLVSSAGATLLKDLTVSVPAGVRTLIKGSNQAAVSALFGATAGQSVAGSGRIFRPANPAVCFLAERPYLPPGGLREALDRGDHGDLAGDDRVIALLRAFDLKEVVESAGGLNGKQDLSSRLSQSERCLLAVVRVLLLDPRFLLLDRFSAVVGGKRAEQVLNALSEQGVTCICCGDDSLGSGLFDAALELRDDGGWTWSENPRKANASAS